MSSVPAFLVDLRALVYLPNEARGLLSLTLLQSHQQYLLLFDDDFIKLFCFLELPLQLIDLLVHLGEYFGLLSVDLSKALLHLLFVAEEGVERGGLGQPPGI